ncbi:prosaposin [Erythrolamprus reginae]|uniref:prosaposin n=1 Tax=Erythrolamprus reginae TaxID=121349 RepID=UPI00396C69F4
MRRFALLVFLCSLAAVALTTPLLLKKDCTKGPEVWCQNLRTASDCKAVKHCQQNVWNKPTVESIPCDLCKEMVQIVGKLLKNNDTTEEIDGYLEKVCEFLPKSDMVDECKEIVESYLPSILDLVKSELENPQVVCSSLTLCQSLQKHLAEVKLQNQLKSNKIPELDFSELASPFMANVPLLLYPQDKPMKETKGNGNGNVCDDCVQLVIDLQEAVRNNETFIPSLIEHAKKQCERLGPSISEVCKGYITEYSSLAIQMIMHMPPEDICNTIGFCSSLKSVPLQALVPAKVISPANIEPVETNPSEKEAFSICEVCTIMVEEVASLLESNKTEEEMIQGMEKVCLVLPKKTREECKDFVETYGKSILDMLLEATSPKLVCVMLRCCNNDNILPAEEIVPVQSEAGNVCDVCKMIVAYADKELAKNATTAEIEAFMERVCHYLPESVSDQCVQFVQQYEPTVVQLLAEMMDPTFVCSKLGVCTAATEPLLGSEFCVRGPGYWCKNMETATECNAVEHCKRHVWN